MKTNYFTAAVTEQKLTTVWSNIIHCSDKHDNLGPKSTLSNYPGETNTVNHHILQQHIKLVFSCSLSPSPKCMFIGMKTRKQQDYYRILMDPCITMVLQTSNFLDKNPEMVE